MKRRTVVWTAATVPSLLAGCLDGSVSGSEESETDESYDATDPDDVVREYLARRYDGDVDGTNELVHPDGPVPEVADGELSYFAIREYEIHEVTLVEETDGRTVVRVEMSTIRPNGREVTGVLEIELRPAGDGWVVWDERLLE